MLLRIRNAHPTTKTMQHTVLVSYLAQCVLTVELFVVCGIIAQIFAPTNKMNRPSKNDLFLKNYRGKIGRIYIQNVMIHAMLCTSSHAQPIFSTSIYISRRTSIKAQFSRFNLDIH